MDFPFLLSLLLGSPFAIGLALLVLPSRAGGLFRGAALLGAGAPLGLLALAPATMARSWIPHIGASYDLVLDGLSAGLVAVTSVVAVAAVATCVSRDRRAFATTLMAETAILGALCAGDALLLLCFAGAAVAAIAALTGSCRFAVVQWLGLSLVLGIYAFCYHEAWSQTGFATSSLSRFQTLVTFPELEWWAFLAGAAGPLIMMVGVRGGEGTGKLFLAVYSLLPGFLLFRLVSSVFPLGASEHATLMRSVGVAFVLFACFAPRARLALALQGIFLVGLFSLQRDGLVAAQIEWAHMVLALTLWELSSEIRRPGVATVAGVLVLVPPGGWLLARSLPTGSLLALAVVWIVFSLRLFRVGRRALSREREREREQPPKGGFYPVALVPVVALSMALYLAPALYRSYLEPSLAPVLPTATAAEDEE